MSEPRKQLARWLPHAVLLALVVAVVVWLGMVIAPILPSLALAASLAAMTYPVLFEPIDRRLARFVPHWSAAQRRHLSAGIATSSLVGILLMAGLALLWSLLGHLDRFWDALWGMLFHDQVQINRLIDHIALRVGQAGQYYPDMGLSSDSVKVWLRDNIHEISVGPAMLHYLLTGTGSLLAQAALTVVTLFYLYSQGPGLTRAVLSFLPLSDTALLQLRHRFHRTCLHLWGQVFGRAAAQGIGLGFLAWWIGGFHFVLVSVPAAFVALLPIVGPGVAWLPLSIVLWRQNHQLEAVALAVSALCMAWLVQHAADRLARFLGTDAVWLSFLIFLAIIGGILGWGLKGLILGPAAVLAASVIIALLPSVYGVAKAVEDPLSAGPPTPLPDEPPAAAAAEVQASPR